MSLRSLLFLLFVTIVSACGATPLSPVVVPPQPPQPPAHVFASTDQAVYATATQTLTNKTIDCSLNTCSNVPAAAPWTIAMDCDVSGESNQTIAPDSTYTFCGKTWTKINSAHESSDMAVVNGSGLEMFPGKTGGLSAEYGPTACLGGGTGDLSAPVVRIPLSQFSISGLDWSTQFRLWLDVSSQTLSAGGDGIVWGIDNAPGTGYSGLTNWYAIYGARCSTGASSPQLVANAMTGSATTGTTTAVTGYSSWTTGNETSVVWLGSLAPIGGQYQELVAYGTAYSGSWTTALVPWTSNTGGAASGKGSSPAVGYANQGPSAIGSDLYFFIAGTGNVAFATASMTIKRIRIDYRL